MSSCQRNNVMVTRHGAQTIIFSHGFGCDQNMWRPVQPNFEPNFRTFLFDHVGAGGSDLSAYDVVKYYTLQGYADDLVEIDRALELSGAIFVGHSVSAMIGVLASIADRALFSRLVLLSPSPRYIDDGDYHGGSAPGDVKELLEAMADNHLGW